VRRSGKKLGFSARRIYLRRKFRLGLRGYRYILKR